MSFSFSWLGELQMRLVPAVHSRPNTCLTTRPAQVNCPKAGVAFYNKLDIKDKKLIEYEVRIHSHRPVLLPSTDSSRAYRASSTTSCTRLATSPTRSWRSTSPGSRHTCTCAPTLDIRGPVCACTLPSPRCPHCVLWSAFCMRAPVVPGRLGRTLMLCLLLYFVRPCWSCVVGMH